MNIPKNKMKYGRPSPREPSPPTEPPLCSVLYLPPLIRNAILEVERNIQAPQELVIASALGAVSLACQDQIEVRTTFNKLISPCSLFFLTIAASGDRKSTVDRHFAEPIIEFEKEKRIEYQNQIIDHNAKMETWSDIRKDLRSDIRKACREGIESKELEKLESKLITHDKNKPNHPKKRKLIYTDATPESIVYGLHRDWPSAAILSDEAGGILNGRAMSDLGMLNQIWDGSSLTVDRKTTESFILSDARLTISLMTQEKSVRKFIERNDGMARDIGFLARCLVSTPLSMQGERTITNSYIENNFSSENLDAFKERLSFILREGSKKESATNHKKLVLNLSTNADRVWVDYFNEIEGQLKGSLASVKDAASKIANNAARMAAIFHYFEVGRSGDISEESMNEAISTCRKFMLNFLNTFGAYGLYSPEKRDVDKLVEWFKLKIHFDENAKKLAKNYVRQNGPIRNSHQLDKALDHLHTKDAVGLTYEDRTEWVNLRLNNRIFKN